MKLNSQNICLLIWDEAYERGALIDEPIIEDAVINGQDAIRQRCTKCAASIFRFKDINDASVFLDMPNNDRCPYPFSLSLIANFKTPISIK